jgi:hypothetical protein
VPYYPVMPLMPGLWGPPSMMFTPCSPWAGWYGPWGLPPMHFHLGWLGHSRGFDLRGYYLAVAGTEVSTTVRKGSTNQ